MMKKTLSLFALIATFAFASAAFANPHHPRMGNMGKRGRGMHNMGPRGHQRGCIFNKIIFLKKVLGLSKSQVTQIMTINLKYKIRDLNYKKVLAPLRIELKKQMLAENLKIPAIKRLLTRISSYQINKKLLRFQKVKEIMALLNPQQKLRIRYIMSMKMSKKRHH